MSIALNSAGKALDNTYGALLLGTFFSLVYVCLSFFSFCGIAEMARDSLYGIILHQTYIYIRSHSHDCTYIQVLVSNPLPSS